MSQCENTMRKQLVNRLPLLSAQRTHVRHILWCQIIPSEIIYGRHLSCCSQPTKASTLGGTNPCQAKEQNEQAFEGTSEDLPTDFEENFPDGVGFQIQISDSSL